jgi:hypothetical protein
MEQYSTDSDAHSARKSANPQKNQSVEQPPEDESIDLYQYRASTKRMLENTRSRMQAQSQEENEETQNLLSYKTHSKSANRE